MITLYTSPVCVKCKIVKMELEKRNIPYEESTDYDFIMNKGFTSLPVAHFHEKNQYSGFNQTMIKIKKMNGEI